MTVTPQLPEVSCCYADADALSLNELEKYLNLFKREGLIGTFHKRQISPETNWVEAFDHHINTASVILLLVSADW